MVKVKYAKTLMAAVGFASRPRNLLIYFLFNILVFSLLVVPLWLGNSSAVAASLTIVAGVVVFLAAILVDATFIQQCAAGKKARLSASFKVARARYPSVLGAAVIMLVINWVVTRVFSLVSDIVAAVAAIVISLLFFFVYQEAVLARRKFYRAVVGSVSLFRKAWLTIVLSWILSSIVSLALVFVFALPLLILASAIMSGVFAGGITEDMTVAIMALSQANMPLLIIAGLAANVGLAMSKLFSIGFITGIYQQLAGKKKA